MVTYFHFWYFFINCFSAYPLLGYLEGGVLVPPPTSPTSVNNRPAQGSHSAQASPTSTLKTVRPRARSADESVSKQKVCYLYFSKLWLEYKWS